MVAERRLSEHALRRYRRRMRVPRATREEVLAILRGARFQVNPPGRMTIASEDKLTYAYAVAGDIVFPLMPEPDGSLLAVTTLRRARPSKEERHARRQEARETAWP